ncbi:MAG: RibD family protein [Verrucomicrobiota bacterium]
MAQLPFVYVNVAMTADGKLAPANRHFVPFSSKRDQQRMMQLRSEADAVLSGARTVDMGEVDLGPGGRKWQKKRLEAGLPEFNLRIIVSGSASVNPDAHIFKTHFSPIILLVNRTAPQSRLKRLSKLVDDIHLSEGDSICFRTAFEWLREKWKVKRLLCEGGGEVNAPIFLEGLVDELHLTIAPIIFGGRNAPTLAEGKGVARLDQAVKLRLKHLEKIGDELYTVYKVLNS